MAILPIKIYGDPVLRELSTNLTLSDTLSRLSLNMAETMYDAEGVGLAAPQIGVPKKLIVVDIGDNDFVAYINPEITYYSKEEEVDEEGCLCLLDIRVPVKRSIKINFKALDLMGRPIEIEAKDFLARVLQHEVDHLGGKTILERTTPDEKKKAVQRLIDLFDQLREG